MDHGKAFVLEPGVALPVNSFNQDDGRLAPYCFDRPPDVTHFDSHLRLMNPEQSECQQQLGN